jgi:hypothetical protein
MYRERQSHTKASREGSCFLQPLSITKLAAWVEPLVGISQCYMHNITTLSLWSKGFSRSVAQDRCFSSFDQFLIFREEDSQRHIFIRRDIAASAKCFVCMVRANDR